jgi:hypothetical protein
MSQRDRRLAPMRNAILETRRVVMDSLSMPQLHKVYLIVMLPPQAVRRLNADDQPSNALDTSPSEIVPPNSSPNIESDAPTPKLLKTPC